MIFIAAAVYLLSRTAQVSIGVKISLGIIFVFLIALGAITAINKNKTEDKEDKEETDEKKDRGLIRNIQENVSWILRNAWNSNAGDVNEELNRIYDIIRNTKEDFGVPIGEYKIDDKKIDEDGLVECEEEQEDGPTKTVKKTLLECQYPLKMLEKLEETIYNNEKKDGEKILLPLKGYKEKREGWRFYVPKVWHEDIGTVNRMPVARNPEKRIIVNTKDNQTAEIDYRIVTVISDPIRFFLRARDQREDQEDQRAEVIFNRISAFFTQEQLTLFGDNKLLTISRSARHLFSIEMRHLGIRATSLEIQTILMPEEIRDTAEYQTVTKQRAEIAATKGLELKTIIDATGANKTAVVLADVIRGGVIDAIEATASVFASLLNKKEKDEVKK